MSYAELHCKTNFSFLQGASHPDELVARAAELGYRALAITDRASVAGVVRAFGHARDLNFPIIVGAEVQPQGGPPVVLWATDRAAYGRLSRLLSLGRMRGPKGTCLLQWEDLHAAAEGLLAGMVVPRGAMAHRQGGHDQRPTTQMLGLFRDCFSDRAYLLCELHRGVDDAGWGEELSRISRQSTIPLVAAGDVHYHTAERMLVHDCVTAIGLGTTIEQLRAQRFANSQRHLRSLPDLRKIYRTVPSALAGTLEIADRCTFRLDELRYEYPEELAPAGMTPLDYLKRLAWQGAKQRWPGGVPTPVVEALRHEFTLITELRYEAYFLTVWDLVRFARQRGILCQGRGSAANSVVCYCLGITSVDPERTEVLFERFISRERNEAPDIDVDFEHQRREEVLQYLYEKYGRQRAGLTAAVVTYRLRSAVREVGKSLGMSADLIDSLAKLAGSHGSLEDLESRIDDAGLDPQSDLGQRFLFLVRSLVGFPRHLSQHSGGMVITRGDLSELCPIENAAMADRTVIQWDKDDLEELGILKIDVLALGMLSALQRSFDLIHQHHGKHLTLATIPPSDSATYDMICQADTMGVFQIESRAQMSMLPRLRPRCYYDLVIEVAIVRPGPIQGNMVHPFLKARQNPASVVYPNKAIRDVLQRTLGVPIFQEQAMRLAVVAAGFTPGEADQLRRAMAAWRRPGVIEQFRTKLMDGMAAKGFSAEFAQQVFHQIKGFGEYGFPESHAASFALLVYASAYIKCHYPEVFCAALLNSQPMGFYAPSQLIADARRHDVVVLPADVNRSDWDCSLERDANDKLAVRLGLRLIRGLPTAAAERLLQNRDQQGPFADQADLNRRLRLGPAVLACLADADALRSMSANRRAALWESLAQDEPAIDLPLLSQQDTDEAPPETLVPPTLQEDVYADYGATGLSLRGHPLGFYRQHLTELQCVTASQLADLRDGRRVRVGGLVMLRQRPATAKGITFVTLEDETGAVNLVIFPDVWRRFYKTAQTHQAWLVDGQLENRQGVIHVVVGNLQPLPGQADELPLQPRNFH